MTPWITTTGEVQISFFWDRGTNYEMKMPILTNLGVYGMKKITGNHLRSRLRVPYKHL